MKKTLVTVVTVIFLISLFTVSAYAGNTGAPQYADKVIFNETYILEENLVLDGNLLAVSSVVIIKENSIITGDVILISSSMNLDGEVSGNVMAFGGVVNLFGNSVIHGDLVTPGTETYRAVGSQIFGQLENRRRHKYEAKIAIVDPDSRHPCGHAQRRCHPSVAAI